MGDKKVSRSIEFSIEDAKRLERLAQNREQLFEEYVSEMITGPVERTIFGELLEGTLTTT